MSSARTRDDRPDQRRRDRSRNRNPRSRRQRRITGYHNVFDELSPPDYDLLGPPLTSDTLQPPEYDCTVQASDVLEVIWERTSPFHSVQMTPWQTVHVELRGTFLQISNAKTHGLLTPAWKRGAPTGAAGRKIRAYTLQHAEVGLASDHKRVEMVPKSPIAQLLPESALRQLQESDPTQFDIVYNYIARLRVESDQILLRFHTSDQRTNWIESICAAIDIAPPIEVRNEPRNHTLPRRRRRQEGQRVAIRIHNGQASAPASIVAEQERILREHYPHLLHTARQSREDDTAEDADSPRIPQDGIDASEQQGDEQQAEPDNEPDPDYQDLDLAFMRDPMAENDPEDDDQHMTDMADIFSSIGQRESAEHQQHQQQPDSPTIPNFDFQNILTVADPSSETNPPSCEQMLTIRPSSQRQRLCSPYPQDIRKYRPRPTRQDPIRDARYRRRCMPMLVHNSRYASNVIMHKGKRKVIDWKHKKLVDWPAGPPSYRDVLDGVAPVDPSKGKQGEQESEDNRDSLPPGAGHAVMRLRRMLRRHASSAEITAHFGSSAAETFRPNGDSQPQSSQGSVPNGEQTRGTMSFAMDRGVRHELGRQASHGYLRSQPHSLDTTPTTTHTASTGYLSSSDDQSSQSPASFTDPKVKTKASNSSAFSLKLRQKFGRKKAMHENNVISRPATSVDDITRAPTRTDSRFSDRDDEAMGDKTIRNRIGTIRTASSMDIMRARF